MEGDGTGRPRSRRAFLGASAGGACALLSGCASLARERRATIDDDQVPIRIAHYGVRNENEVERALESLQQQFHEYQAADGTAQYRLTFEAGGVPVDAADYDDRDETIAAVEDQLADAGTLREYDVHLIEYADGNVFDWTDMLGAGFSVWQAGEADSTPAYAADVKDGRSRRYSGRYSFAFVNRLTELIGTPLNNTSYRNTVVHEVGHCFHCQHEHGTIHRRHPPFDADQASPMASWYAGSTLSVFNNGWEPTRFHDVEESRSAGTMTSTLSPATLEQLHGWVREHDDWFGSERQ